MKTKKANLLIRDTHQTNIKLIKLFICYNHFDLSAKNKMENSYMVGSS